MTHNEFHNTLEAVLGKSVEFTTVFNNEGDADFDYITLTFGEFTASERAHIAPIVEAYNTQFGEELVRVS